jgi:hypothetical protein
MVNGNWDVVRALHTLEQSYSPRQPLPVFFNSSRRSWVFRISKFPGTGDKNPRSGTNRVRIPCQDTAVLHSSCGNEFCERSFAQYKELF